MKAILLILAVFTGVSLFAQDTVYVTKTTDPDMFLYTYNNVDSLCDPEMYGTLQWAFRKALDSPTGTFYILFDIPGLGPHIILLNYGLPQLTRRVVIDGTSQEGYQYGQPKIIIDGGSDLSNGILLYNSLNSIVKGLTIRNFLYSGILCTAINNATISENVIYNIYRNLYDLRLGEGPLGLYRSSGNIVKGNIIGTDNTDDSLACRFGINIQALASPKVYSPSSYNIIGGINPGEGNVITNVITKAVLVGAGNASNRISGNQIYNNGTAIFLSPPSDYFVFGGNYNKAEPVIESFDGTSVTGTSGSHDIIEIFGSTGNENANEYLTTVYADIDGNWTANVITTYPGVIATATNNNNTSAFSSFLTSSIPGSSCSNALLIVPTIEYNYVTYNMDVNQTEFWIKFIADSTNSVVGLNVLVDTSDIGFSSVQVFSGSCTSLNLFTESQSLYDNWGLTIPLNNLTIGNTYYIKVISMSNISFNLSLLDITTPKANESNCIPNDWTQVGTGFNPLCYGLTVYNNNLIAVGRAYPGGVRQWDGSNISSLGTGIDLSSASDVVFACAVYNGELYVGGHFQTAGGIPANNIAKWNGTSWSSVGSGTNTTIKVLYVYNGVLYAGGWFTSAGGVSASRIAKWDGTNWSALGTGVFLNSGAVNCPVWSILEYNDELYVGGTFDNAGGVAVNNIAKWDGTSWSNVGLGTNGRVCALSIYNNDLYVGGWFTSAGGNSANYIAKWNGTNWYSIPGLNNTVKSFKLYNGNLVVGGNFTTAGANTNTNFIASFNGTDWSNWSLGFNNLGGDAGVHTIEEYNGDLYAGGVFSATGTGYQAMYLAKWCPCTISVTTTVQNESCPGSFNGSATVNISNGQLPYSYIWDDPQNQTTATAYNLCAGIYHYTVSDATGCSITGQVTVTVNNPFPSANFSFSPFDNIENYPVIFDVTNYNSNTTYTWNWFDGTITLNSHNPSETHTFPYPGYYNVRLTATNSCGTSKLSQNIYIIPNQGSYAPTPNCLSSFSYDHIDLNISSSVPPWNTGSTIYIKGTLTIEAGGLLTVSNGTTVAFGPQGKVIVEAGSLSGGTPIGGRLVIDNATFTGITVTNCNGTSVKMMWQGIEVLGWPSSSLPAKQGNISIRNGALIEDAYNGVTLGKHKLVVSSGNRFMYDAHDPTYCGGVIKASGSVFNRCCVGIKFFEYFFYSSDSYINNCYFSCNTGGTNSSLLDPYFICTPTQSGDEYGNSNIVKHNPFYNAIYSGNYLGRSIKGIDIFGRQKLTIRDNVFNYCETGVCGTDARLLSIIQSTGNGNKFLNNLVSIRLGYITYSITNSFTIKNSSFNNFGVACLLYSGMNVTMQNNNFNYPFPGLQSENRVAMDIFNTTNLNVIDNQFTSLMYGVRCSNSGTFSSLIGYQSIGNTFTRCRWPIITTNNNSMLNIRCNNFDNSSNLDYSGKTWDIYGTLPDQGHAGSNVKDPAGNWFQQHQFPNIFNQIDANTSQYFNYWPHTTPITIPTMFSTTTSTFSIMPGTVAFSSVADACTPVPTTPIPVPYQIIQDKKDQVDLLMQEYVNILSGLDNGQTAVLLTAIENNVPIQTLKNMLISNSPLSDTVLIAFINRNHPTAPPIFRDVIIPNSPVSENVYPELNNKLASMPKPFAEQISQKQIANPDYRTLTSIKREIAVIENERQSIVNDNVRYYLDNDSVQMAIDILEQENNNEIAQGLVGVYLENGNLSASSAKLSALPVNTPEDIAFRDLYTLYIDLASQQKTIWDIDSVQYTMVENIAMMCPVSVATLNAQEVLFRIAGAKFVPCPESIIARYGNNNSHGSIHLGIEAIEYLGNNVPNPFRTTTTIPYFIPKGSIGKLIITDIDGKEIKIYTLSEGSNKLELSLEGYGNGMYFYTLNIDDGRIVRHKKMVLNW